MASAQAAVSVGESRTSLASSLSTLGYLSYEIPQDLAGPRFHGVIL